MLGLQPTRRMANVVRQAVQEPTKFYGRRHSTCGDPTELRDHCLPPAMEPVGLGFRCEPPTSLTGTKGRGRWGGDHILGICLAPSVYRGRDEPAQRISRKHQLSRAGHTASPRTLSHRTEAREIRVRSSLEVPRPHPSTHLRPREIRERRDHHDQQCGTRRDPEHLVHCAA